MAMVCSLQQRLQIHVPSPLIAFSSTQRTWTQHPTPSDPHLKRAATAMAPPARTPAHSTYPWPWPQTHAHKHRVTGIAYPFTCQQTATDCTLSPGTTRHERQRKCDLATLHACPLIPPLPPVAGAAPAAAAATGVVLRARAPAAAPTASESAELAGRSGRGRARTGLQHVWPAANE